MKYHTNHSWCNTSCWNNEQFDGKVMVIFSEHIDTDSISEYDHQISDPDFWKLTEKKSFFDEEELQQRIKIEKEFAIEENKVFDEAKYIERAKNWMTKESITLKPEVIQWLNKNIKDKTIKNKDTQTPLADLKGWAIGNDKYNSNQSHEIKVFFARQVDALKFIRKFSIFKLPTFYFDYFRDDRREMESKEIIKIINLNSKYKLNYNNYKFVNKREEDEEETSTNLDYHTFELLDWEKNKKDHNDDIDMTKEEIEKAVKEILSVDKENIKTTYDYDYDNMGM
jgi:hypothetical protein